MNTHAHYFPIVPHFYVVRLRALYEYDISLIIIIIYSSNNIVPVHI